MDMAIHHRINRRAMLASTISLLALARCAAASASTALINAENVAATVVLAGMQEAPLISADFPKLLPPATLLLLTNSNKTGYLDQAQALLASLQKLLMTGISDAEGALTLDKVEVLINQAMTYLGPILNVASATIPGLAQAQAIIQDIILALPLVEDFINSIVTNATTVASAKTAMSRAAALHGKGAQRFSAQAAYADLKARLAAK